MESIDRKLKAEDTVEVLVLTPENIPDFAKKSGRSEWELMQQYRDAKSLDQKLYGFIAPAPLWQDEVAAE